MFSFNLFPTDEYERLLDYFRSNDMVYENDLPLIIPHFIKGYKLTQGDDYIVGGAILGYREGKYILDGIAVDKVLRKSGLGRILVNKIIEEVKQRNGNSLYLITKVPEFYLKQNFTFVDGFDEVHNIFNCEGCKKYLKDCPERVMKIEL